MPQVQEKKTKTRQEMLHIPLLLRRAEDVNRTPAFGSGVLLPGQARQKPIETVCSLFDYGMDASLATQWQEWELLAITSSMDNEYSEGSSRGRLLRFSAHFKPLITAWLQLYLRITPEGLRPPMLLPAAMAVESPEAVIGGFIRKYDRADCLKELWCVLDAVLVNPATSAQTRINLLSGYEVMACIIEASFALGAVPGKPRG